MANTENYNSRAWYKTIVITSFYIRSYNSFAPSPRHALSFPLFVTDVIGSLVDDVMHIYAFSSARVLRALDIVLSYICVTIIKLSFPLSYSFPPVSIENYNVQYVNCSMGLWVHKAYDKHYLQTWWCKTCIFMGFLYNFPMPLHFVTMT